MKCWEESRGMELKNAQFSSHSSDLLLYVNNYWKERPNWHRNDNWPFSVIKTVTRSAPIGEKLHSEAELIHKFKHNTFKSKVCNFCAAELNQTACHWLSYMSAFRMLKQTEQIFDSITGNQPTGGLLAIYSHSDWIG